MGPPGRDQLHRRPVPLTRQLDPAVLMPASSMVDEQEPANRTEPRTTRVTSLVSRRHPPRAPRSL